jgi:hypothetical protein
MSKRPGQSRKLSRVEERGELSSRSTYVGEGAVGQVEERGQAPGGRRLPRRLLQRQPRHGSLRRRRRPNPLCPPRDGDALEVQIEGGLDYLQVGPAHQHDRAHEPASHR